MSSVKEIMAAGLKALKEHPDCYVAINAKTCELVAYGPDLKDVHERALGAVPDGKVFFLGSDLLNPSQSCPTTILKM